MFPFKSKRSDEKSKRGLDSTINSDELFPDAKIGATTKEIKTKLSFHPEATVSQEDKYYFQFLNNELAPLQENQISISGVDLKRDETGLLVKAIVRNSLSKSIKFEQMPLLLIGPNGERLARKEFNLAELGDLPAESSRPWQFHFEDSTLLVDEFPQSEWKLAFELKKEAAPHSLDLEDSWNHSLADQDREQLVKLVQTIQPPKPGEVNFMGLQATTKETGDLHITILIRNGTQKNVSLQQLPLIVEDASGEVVAKGGFTLNEFEVKSNTSKPWTFIFPANIVLKENPDFSTWKVYPPQQNA